MVGYIPDTQHSDPEHLSTRAPSRAFSLDIPGGLEFASSGPRWTPTAPRSFTKSLTTSSKYCTRTLNDCHHIDLLLEKDLRVQFSREDKQDTVAAGINFDLPGVLGLEGVATRPQQLD